MDNPPPWRRLLYARLNVDPDIAGDAFRGYRDTLATAITQDDIPQLANSLYSKNIISQDNLDRAMMIGILPSEKMVHLLDAIEARIRSNPFDFLTVLDILNSEPVFRVHAKRIWEKYKGKYDQEEQERVSYEKILNRSRRLIISYYGFNEEDSIFTADVEKAEQELIARYNKVLQEQRPTFEYGHIKVAGRTIVKNLVDLGAAVDIQDERDDSDAEESAEEDDENNDSDEESADSTKSKLRKKKSLLSRMRKGVRKMFGAARDMTSSVIKEALSALNLDVKIFRKYKKRFDKHTNREQVRWWFEIWGDEGALKALELKWEDVSSQNKWRLETCPVPPPQRC